MTYAEFINRFLDKKLKEPTYRLGQYFVYLFGVEDEESNLWELDGLEATIVIHSLIKTYHWDYADLPAREDRC